MSMDILVASNGVCVVQTGDILLALTEDLEQAKIAQKELSPSTNMPYNYQYTLYFASEKDREYCCNQLLMFLGNYLSNFIIQDNRSCIVLSGFCIL